MSPLASAIGHENDIIAGETKSLRETLKHQPAEILEKQNVSAPRSNERDDTPLFDETSFADERFAPNLAVRLAPALLERCISLLARKYTAEMRIAWTESMGRASHWSCRFLSADQSTLDTFFADVRRSALAQSGPSGHALALAAGCQAWQSLRADPAFAPADSLRARLRALAPSERKNYLNATARFHHDSCRLEGVDIPVEKIAAQLKAGYA
jgi:hypothetical protein